MAACPSTDPSDAQSAPAALAASTYAPTVGGVAVTGWFLPSRDELNQLDSSNLPSSNNGVGGLTSHVFYWSSSQSHAFLAWFQGVGYGGGHYWPNYDFERYTNQVRPIRAF
jgi:hypothetical protein